jgi:hypothetical protein
MAKAAQANRPQWGGVGGPAFGTPENVGASPPQINVGIGRRQRPGNRNLPPDFEGTAVAPVGAPNQQRSIDGFPGIVNRQGGGPGTTIANPFRQGNVGGTK